MEKFNLNKLVKITVLEREESSMYVYKRHQKKTWFKEEVQEGVHRDFFGSKYIDVDDVESIVLIDFKVYIKDRVVLSFESDIKHVVYFDSLRHANSYAHQIELESKQNIISFT
tara:strand:- start:11835 stop:12173 length:339 start_codon:yes stop_codon:yes gene_type:complete